MPRLAQLLLRAIHTGRRVRGQERVDNCANFLWQVPDLGASEKHVLDLGQGAEGRKAEEPLGETDGNFGLVVRVGKLLRVLLIQLLC